MEDKPTITQIGIRYGIIIGLIFMIYGLILQFLNLEVKVMQYFGYFNYLMLGITVYLGHKTFKEGGNGYMNLGDGIGLGMIITLISGVMAAIFSYTYMKLIDDSIIDKIVKAQVREMEVKGMSEAQIDQALSFSSMFMSPEMIAVFSVFGMLFFGFIVVLVVSFITKKPMPIVDV